MGSVFDAPTGMVKADGQVHGAYQAPPPAAAQPTVPGDEGAIHALVRMLAQAFAPKSITQAKPRTAENVAAATGDQSPLGSQF